MCKSCGCGVPDETDVSETARQNEMKKSNSVLLKGLTRFAEERGVPSDPEETTKLQKSAGKIGWGLDLSQMSSTDIYKANLLGNQFANRLCKYASDIGAYIPLYKAQEIGRLAAAFVMQNNVDPKPLFTEAAYRKALEGKLDPQRTTDEYVSVISEVFSPKGGSENFVNTRSPGMGPGKISVEPGHSGRGPRTGTVGTSEESVEQFTDRATDTRYPEGRGVQGRPFRVYDASNPPGKLPTLRDIPVATYERPTELVTGPGYQPALVKTVPPTFTPEQIQAQKEMFSKMMSVPTEDLDKDYKTALEKQARLEEAADAQTPSRYEEGDVSIAGTPHEREPTYPIVTEDDTADSEAMDRRANFLEAEARKRELEGDWVSRDALISTAKSLRASASERRGVNRFQGI